jgi:hypothetical protein
MLLEFLRDQALKMNPLDRNNWGVGNDYRRRNGREVRQGRLASQARSGKTVRAVRPEHPSCRGQ